jgi:sugar/nucleoside kinase (ribokinase family)
LTYDVVGVGANSVDFVYRLPAYPRPDSAFAKLPISHHVVSCGGQVTTALATCAAMGLRTAYVGTVGSDENAGRMCAELDARGIDASSVVSREGTNPFAVILLDDREGERVVLWSRGPHLRLTPRDITPDVFTGASLVHVDDVDLDASIAAARVARERSLPVTSDIERTSDEVSALVEAVTVPIFAEHVPMAITGEQTLAAALRALWRPHHTFIVVTRGPRGAMMLAGDEVIDEPGIAVKTVDTTGAGDIFRGAFIYALLRGDTPSDILRFANTAAAISCTRVGAMASAPTVEDVQLALEQQKA